MLGTARDVYDSSVNKMDKDPCFLGGRAVPHPASAGAHDHVCHLQGPWSSPSYFLSLGAPLAPSLLLVDTLRSFPLKMISTQWSFYYSSFTSGASGIIRLHVLSSFLHFCLHQIHHSFCLCYSLETVLVKIHRHFSVLRLNRRYSIFYRLVSWKVSTLDFYPTILFLPNYSFPFLFLNGWYQYMCAFGFSHFLLLVCSSSPGYRRSRMTCKRLFFNPFTLSTKSVLPRDY